MLAALILEVMEGNVEDSLKVGIRDQMLREIYIYFRRIYIIISLFCLCVCLSGYRLGPWISYRLETGIIKTNMT
jgi:hypothetical protein